MSYNRVAGRTQYSGTALQFAKVVCDAAQVREGRGVCLYQSQYESKCTKGNGPGCQA